MPRRKKLFFKIELVSLIFPNKYWISAASSSSFSFFYVYPFCPNPLFFLVLAIWGFCKRSLPAFLESFQVQKWKQPQGWSAVRAASGWVEPRGCACGKKAHKWRRPRNEDTNPQYTHTHHSHIQHHKRKNWPFSRGEPSWKKKIEERKQPKDSSNLLSEMKNIYVWTV